MSDVVCNVHSFRSTGKSINGISCYTIRTLSGKWESVHTEYHHQEDQEEGEEDDHEEDEGTNDEEQDA